MGGGLSQPLYVFIAVKRTGSGQGATAMGCYLKDNANGRLQGPAAPWSWLSPCRACLSSPLAGSSQRPIQTDDHWGFIQILNGLLVFEFLIKFYCIFYFYNYCKNNNY
jgi:hypothetical protein